MRAGEPRAGSVPPRPSPRWRTPIRSVHTIKNTRCCQVFSSAKLNEAFGARRMCAIYGWVSSSNHDGGEVPRQPPSTELLLWPG